MTDDLFTPTIPAPAARRSPPWPPESIFFPAFFGGPLAAAVLGVVNGYRLRSSPAKLAAIVAAAVAAFGAVLALDAVVGNRGPLVLSGTVTWLVVFALQRRPFRAFSWAGGEPARMLWPGLAAAAGGFVVSVVVMFVVIGP